MPSRTGTAHVVTTTRTYKGKVYRTHLLRRSYREDGKVKNETLGNLSHLPEPLIELVRRSLQGETFVPLGQAFEVIASRPHGPVQAVAQAMQRLGLASLLASKPCRERDLVLAMVAARIVAPHTKLATTRWWHTTTLAEEFGVADANEDDLYAAMDWLLARQDAVQTNTADRVRAHILLCMLAYYVEWHLREAWRELMFADTDPAAKATRDPVAPAQRSKKALEKVASRTLDDGTPAHSFSTLMAELATVVRNTCRTPSAGPEAPTFDIVTTPNAKQRRALELIEQISV